MNAELQARVNVWREKARKGTLTLEDQIEATLALREGRKSAAVVSEKSRTAKAKAATPAPDGDDLLSEMMG